MGPDVCGVSKAAPVAEIGVSLSTSRKSVQKLKNSLQAKARSEISYRLYSLWHTRSAETTCSEKHIGAAAGLRRRRFAAGFEPADRDSPDARCDVGGVSVTFEVGPGLR